MSEAIERKWYWRFLLWSAKWLGIAGAGAALAGGIVVLSAYFIITPRNFDLAAIEKANRIPGITFLDAYGELLATRGAYHGDKVTLDSLPDHLVLAFLATEDRRFFSHYGIDPRGLLRALVANLRAGRTVEGGSTITQQLAKNLFLSSDRTMTRKLNEMLYAIWLERHMTKDEILALYLNRIYMGAGTYGVDAAARFYFDKPAAEVSLAEAAMLAGLPKAPTRFAPTANLSSAQSRAKLVLTNLVDAGFMEEEDVAEARTALGELKPTDRSELAAVQYFFDYVNEMVPALLGAPTTDDIVIQTTLDTKIQKLAEEALVSALEKDKELLNATQGALVSIDPDGAVRAMVGGVSYLDSQFNRATQAVRQPGSAFKPFVFLAALENGYTAESIVEDAPIEIGGYTPENYNDSYQGPVTLRQALAQSLNTVAVRLAQEVTPAKVIGVAERLGIHSPLNNDLSLALGSSGVTLFEMTSAFSVFANNGLAPQIHAILRIETDGGEVLYEFAPPEKSRVIETQIAEDMTNMMFQVIHSGTGRAARLGDRPAAGKTGTSQDWRDAWFVGYTAQLITGVWVGNDDETPMRRVTGGSLSARIWKDFMSRAHEGVKIAEIPGGYPMRDSKETRELKSYFDELSSDFGTVASDAGSAPPTEENAPPPEEKPKKKPWWQR